MGQYHVDGEQMAAVSHSRTWLGLAQASATAQEVVFMLLPSRSTHSLHWTKLLRSIRKNFLITAVWQWNRLLQKVVNSSLLEVFKKRLGALLLGIT